MKIVRFSLAVALACSSIRWSAALAACNMEVSDDSVSPQLYSACGCGDSLIKVDYRIKITCCDGYDGPLVFTEFYRRNHGTGKIEGAKTVRVNGRMKTVVTNKLSLTCSCEGCPSHEVDCEVELAPSTTCSGDNSPGDSSEGTSQGTGDDPADAEDDPNEGDGLPPISVPSGVPNLLLSLGRDRSGNASGHIAIDPAEFLSGESSGVDALKIVGNRTTGLDIVTDPAGHVRQIMAAECFVMVVPGAGDAFTLDFYTPSSVGPDYDADGFYVLRPGSRPYVSYSVGQVGCDAVSRTLPIVERRPGARDVMRSLVMRRSEGSTFWGLSREDGLRETGIEILPDRNRRSVVYSGGARIASTEKVYGWSGGARRMIAEVRRSVDETKTRRFEYYPDGNVLSETDDTGLRTEYAYDGSNRTVLERQTDPSTGRVRERRMSYAPLGVRPHDPSGAGGLGIADDDGSQDAGRARLETEFVDGVVVSKTFRFVGLDTSRHRIIEEVRLVNPQAADLRSEWDNPANVRTYSDYLPYDRCKPCSELPSMLVHEDGTVDRYAYSAGEYEPGPDGTAGVFTDSCCGVGDWFRTVITHYAKGGVAVPFVTTRDVKIEIRSSKKLLLREQHVCTGPGPDDYARVSWTAITRDEVGQETLTVKSDGTRVEKAYAGRRLASMTDAEGLTTTYTYDALGRVIAETKSGGGFRPDTVTATVYDGEDHVLSRTVSSGGLSRTETREYDGFGRRVTETDAAGIVTKYLYATDTALGLETRMTIRAFGTDCAVTNTTVSYADGRTKETRLNGIVKTAHEYGPNWTKTYEGPAGIASPRWSCSCEDALGRTVCETRPGFRGALLITSNEYNTANQLVATRTYAADPTFANSPIHQFANLQPLTSAIICYNSLGQRCLTVSDMNLNGDIDWSDTDRIVSNDTRYVSLDGDWWRESSSWQTRRNGSSELTLMGLSRTRLTGLGDTVRSAPSRTDDGTGLLVAETRSLDPLGNETISRSFLDRSSHTTTRTTLSPASSLAAQTVVQSGLALSSRSPTGVTTTYAYDALGRQISQTDGRGNTSQIVYDAQGRVAKTIDPLGNETTCAYDALGHQTAVTDPLGHTVTTAYDAEGRVTSQRGATYPVDYTYDAYGNKVAMTTYRDDNLTNGDTTRWLYDEPSGCMTNKVYADGKGPTYSYTPDGKLSRRTWARGIVTDYTYDNAGNLTRTEYSDTTPTITMSYDRVGNLINATTAGVVTNLYAYDIYGHCTNEWQNDFQLTRYYDTLGRSTGYAINGTRQTTIAYDTYGRIATMSVPAAEEGENLHSPTPTPNSNFFHWTYLPGSDLKSTLAYPNGLTASWTYDANNQLLQVRNARTVPSSPSMTTEEFEIISQFDYTYDAAGRRTAITRSGTAFGDLSGSIDAYTYNARSELTSARRTKNGQPIPGFSEDFDYDPIGNRRSSATYNEKGEAQTSTYQANNLNQYTSRTTPGYAAVRGEADPAASVTVNENPAYRFGSYFFGSDIFDNSRSGRTADLLTYATLAQTAASGNEAEDLVSAETNKVYIPAASEILAYDDDGNQTLITTKTGRWRVTYNGENRPVRWVRDSDNTTLVMSYDHMGRRRTKNAQRFVYNGYLQIANHHSSTSTSYFNYYLWDPTEPVATRPLAWNSSTSQPLTSQLLFYTHDGNKNVSEVVAANGSLAAHYEYAPFGAVIICRDGTSQPSNLPTPQLALANPWRFSSEYAEDSTATVYYNYRHYEPVMGRWLNRDPMLEIVSINLQAFCCNATFGYDVRGLAFLWYYQEKTETADIPDDYDEKRYRAIVEALKGDGKVIKKTVTFAYTLFKLRALTVVCECVKGKYKYKDAVVSVGAEVHFRKKYNDNPPKKWVSDKEDEHVEDLKLWYDAQVNDASWDVRAKELCFEEYDNKKICQTETAKSLVSLLENALVNAGLESNKKRHKDNAHTWQLP